ncbi:hypothetical protein Pcinc_038188 [Petrolisthes cinctipes]|uniref:Uncharacterized protein n=1 Tax=Petrolisthes cinctipes TaxID=88211 RepID=A0AAE1BRK3_PETCI|nr:hypothetical protein Pcinc_038188 [Petrolisthes cinctipes]
MEKEKQGVEAGSEKAEKEYDQEKSGKKKEHGEETQKKSGKEKRDCLRRKTATSEICEERSIITFYGQLPMGRLTYSKPGTTFLTRHWTTP